MPDREFVSIRRLRFGARWVPFGPFRRTISSPIMGIGALESLCSAVFYGPRLCAGLVLRPERIG